MRSLLVGFVAILLVASVFGTAIGTGVGVEDESLSGVSVAEEDPVEIYDWHDLDDVRDDLDGDYVLINNLDENTDGYDELVDTEKGWEPIGEFDEDENIEFTGTFDGNGYEIKDLYITRPNEWGVGLFGVTNHGAEITDIGVIDAEVSGDWYTGVIVGRNNGTIENSYAAGEVSGENFVGGLLGSNSWYSSVKNSYVRVSVNGENTIGGLAGDNAGIIDDSYSTGNVNGFRGVGGLVGLDGGKVNNSYSTGEVNGEAETLTQVGGLVGIKHGRLIKNSYATGTVNGEEKVGGLVGHNRHGTVENSFWDIETSGIDESDGGTGLRTEEMTGEQAPNNMEGFDFEEIWETVEEDHEDAEEDGYPILQELSREKQLQHVYPADPVEDDGIPGFTSTLLLLAAMIAVVIYKKKER